MGLFKRKPKPEAPQLPTVFVTHEARGWGVTSRFFFVNQLMQPWRTETVGKRTIHTSGDVLPDRETYMALYHELHAIIGESDDPMTDYVRCYPHYIALSWDASKQPEEHIDEAQARVERDVVNLLGEYFGWEKPYRVGTFDSFQEKLDMAEKLRVNWRLGSYH
jgi:hypothetical protein